VAVFVVATRPQLLPASPPLLLFIYFVYFTFFFGPWLEVGDLRVTPGLLLWLPDRLLHHLTQQRQLPRSIVLLPIPAAAAPPLITMIP